MNEAGLVAAIAAAGAVLAVSVIVWYVLLVIANWRIFTKAGEAGWKSIIPIYNMYILYKISWKTTMFWIVIAAFVLCGILSPIGGAASAIGAIFSIAAMIIGIIQNYKLAKAFGHGVGFTIGLIIFSPIFFLILGFGSSKYIGKSDD